MTNLDLKSQEKIRKSIDANKQVTAKLNQLREVIVQETAVQQSLAKSKWKQFIPSSDSLVQTNSRLLLDKVKQQNQIIHTLRKQLSQYHSQTSESS